MRHAKGWNHNKMDIACKRRVPAEIPRPHVGKLMRGNRRHKWAVRRLAHPLGQDQDRMPQPKQKRHGKTRRSSHLHTPAATHGRGNTVHFGADPIGRDRRASQQIYDPHIADGQPGRQQCRRNAPNTQENSAAKGTQE